MKKRVFKILKIALCFCVAVLTIYAPKRVVAKDFCSFTIYALGKSYHIFPPELNYGLDGVKILALDQLCDRIYLDTLKKPRDAEITFLASGANPFSISKEVCGQAITRDGAKRQIERALLMGRTSVNLKAESIFPAITREQLIKKTQFRGKYCTYFGNSSEGRKHNVWLCVSALNGSIVRNGESFSFNKRVGERSRERGYKSAKVIQNGEFVDGIGGGVCQVSTTLYNALLKAGLKITEFHPHSLAVGYVAPSFDAMVSEVCDLKFENDTGSDVYIYAYCDDANLTVCVYGIKNEYEYKLTSNVIQKIQPNPVYVPIKRAEGVKEVAPKEGIKSEGYLSAYKNGELVFNRKLRSDNYGVVDGVIIVNEENVE